MIIENRSESKNFIPEIKILKDNIIKEIIYPEKSITENNKWYSISVLSEPGFYNVLLNNKTNNSTIITKGLYVKYPPNETDDMSADYETMKKIAETTGGRNIGFEEINKVLQEKSKSITLSAIRKLKKKSVWDNFYLFVILVSTLCVDWYIRRRNAENYNS